MSEVPLYPPCTLRGAHNLHVQETAALYSVRRGRAGSVALTHFLLSSSSLLTSDDTREAHSFLESGHMLTFTRTPEQGPEKCDPALHRTPEQVFPPTFFFFISLKPRFE